VEPHEAIHFRNQFRDARALALKDAELYQEVLFVLERFGSFLTGRIQDLRRYEKKIVDFARTSPLADGRSDSSSWQTPFSALYEYVRVSRNDALHQGAFARQLTAHVVKLAVVLEDALMADAAAIADYMVHGPVCAYYWQPLGFIRQQLLLNSFSYLPILSDDGSPTDQLISDFSLAHYLGRDQSERKTRLAQTLRAAIDSSRLETTPTISLPLDTPVKDALQKMTGLPVLVVSKSDAPARLVGLLTPFDVL
jgi:CBS domain-containing protein